MGEVRHAGKRKFWSGLVHTACGLVLEDAEHTWRGVNCPACKRAKAEGRWPR